MTHELAQKLADVWALCKKSHVIGVTSVTTGVLCDFPSETTPVTGVTEALVTTTPHVTEIAVTPQKPNGYNGYAGYASKTAVPDECAEFAERAAIAEVCGALPQSHAEVLAALHVADLGPDRDHIIDVAARVLDRMVSSPEKGRAGDE